MHKNRRKFLEQLGVVGAGLVGIPYLTTGCDSKSISTDQSNTISSNLAMDIGVQIYSVRNELNEDLETSPEDVNNDPYDKGWMIKMKVSNPGDLDNLLSSDEYKKLIGE